MTDQKDKASVESSVDDLDGAISQDADGTTIDLGGGDMVLLQGFAGLLDNSHFDFG